MDQPKNTEGNFPSYRDLLTEAGRHIASRKWLLMRRTLLMVWPGLVAVVAWYILEILARSGNGEVTPEFALFAPTLISVFIIVGILFGAPYYTIMSGIFKIEKTVWIDSFFDGRNLDSKTSWRIARRLFWKYVFFELQILFRYYGILVLVLCAVFVAAGAGGWLDAKYDFKSISPQVIGGMIVAATIALYAWVYYLRTRLRYADFLFLDRVSSSGVRYADLFREMEELNQVRKREAFIKALVANVGSDTLKGITRILARDIAIGMGQLGAGGKVAGAVIGTYAQELSRQAIDLGNIAARYLMYRVARKIVYGSEQEINEYLYRLGNDKLMS
ncbi:MAG: hypothetical protein AAB518_00350 [Patescibacteria group bacterium]